MSNMLRHKISPFTSSTTAYTSIPIYADSPTITTTNSPDHVAKGGKIRDNGHHRRQDIHKGITFRQHLFSSKSILARFLSSFLPPLGPFTQTPLDYEGTALSIFLLTAILFSRTGSGRNGIELFPLALPSLYVFTFTTLIYLISKLTKTRITFRELFCLCGYGLFGSTLTLLLAQISDRLFFPSLIILTGLNSVRITLTLFFRTRIPALRFILGTPTAIIHIIFPIYLYYATKP